MSVAFIYLHSIHVPTMSLHIIYMKIYYTSFLLSPFVFHTETMFSHTCRLSEIATLGALLQ